MHIYRWLYISGNDQNNHLDIQGPFLEETDAVNCAKTQFEAVVKESMWTAFEIPYDERGFAWYSDGNISFDFCDGMWTFSSEKGACYGSISHHTFHLTADELETAYREQKVNYLLEDAEKHFVEDYLGIVPEAEEGSEEEENNTVITQGFLYKYGFGWEKALDRISPYYLLRRFADNFESRFDASRPESDQWLDAIFDVLSHLK